jgi:hypothetical protein
LPTHVGIPSSDYEGGDTTDDYGDYGGGGSGGSDGGSGGSGDGWDGDGDSGECRVNYGDGGARRRDAAEEPSIAKQQETEEETPGRAAE